ncbi:STAS domain-containing protein [Sporosarcina sp. PTS2304]|uniref:STAS domain-containing protein n=1 Tax=Sporosarcina sp. PTS2304 TaxID=2283194 RepID=UPI001F0749E7|nr:STAS domain-containing protein [Sporosarcina sp. PTS2304]
MNELHNATQELHELKAKLVVYEKLIEELSAPIIPSIVPDTILVPITGVLSVERFMLIQEKIVRRIADNNVYTAILDFTDISTLEVENNMGYESLSRQINELVNILSLMGTETIFVGFSSTFAQQLILSNVADFSQIRVYINFRAALQYLLEQKGLEIVEKK